MAKIDNTVLGAMAAIPVWGTIVVAVIQAVDNVLEFAIGQTDLGAEINCIRHEIGGIGFGNKIVPAIALDIKRKLTGDDNTWGDETILQLTPAAQSCLKFGKGANGLWNPGMFIWSKIQEDIFDLFGNTVNSNTERARREAQMALQGVYEDAMSGKFIIKPIIPVVLNQEQADAALSFKVAGPSPVLIGVVLIAGGLAIRAMRGRRA